MRYEAIGLVAIVFSVAAFLVPWMRGGCWTRSIPTLALAIVERTGGSKAGASIHEEVDRRINAGKVTGWSASILADSLVRNLQDDQVRWNADRAERLLDQMGPEAEMALQRTLRTGDNQARVLAAAMLRHCQFPPSDDLLWACVEDLRDDSKTVDWYISLGNASAAADYLVPWFGQSIISVRTR